MNKRIQTKMEKIAKYYHKSFTSKEEFIMAVNWEQVCWKPGWLSEEFMEEFHENLNWRAVCYSQRMSEKFIRKYSEHMHWGYVARHQHIKKFSAAFMNDFAVQLNIKEIIFSNGEKFKYANIEYDYQLGDEFYVTEKGRYYQVEEKSCDGTTLYLSDQSR